MTTVKFDHAVKYKGKRYVAHENFSVDEEDLEALKNEGAHIISTTVTPVAVVENDIEDKVVEKSEDDINHLREELLSYRVDELIQFAQDHEINLKGKTRKADIYNIIVAGLN